MKQTPLLYIAIALVILLAATFVWLLTAEGGGGNRPGGEELRTATNPGLDLRYGYDPQLFTPAPYDAHAEYPLRLDAEGFSFYGKRIRGLGRMLEHEPQSQLFDFLGTEDTEEYENTYKLRRSYEVYEDAWIQGKLALHNILTYEFTAESRRPTYFPESVGESGVVHIEGWALFSAQDLFYFYAIGAEPLSEDERAACVAVLESLEFNALLGGGEPGETPGEDTGEEPDQAPSEDQQEAPEVPDAANPANSSTT